MLVSRRQKVTDPPDLTQRFFSCAVSFSSRSGVEGKDIEENDYLLKVYFEKEVVLGCLTFFYRFDGHRRKTGATKISTFDQSENAFFRILCD